jgi:uncharacterized protein YkwD
MRPVGDVFVLVVAIAAACGAGAAQAQQFEVPASAKAAIISDTNAYRATKGLPPLSENTAASREAQAYADYLAETTKQGHSADGRSPFFRLRTSGAKFCKFRGENWHESWTRPVRSSSEAAVAAAMTFWRHSPGHERALRSASTEIGVGVAGWRHGDQWYYQEIQVFIDTSCLKSVQTAANQEDDEIPPVPDRKPTPSRPERNPLRTP